MPSICQVLSQFREPTPSWLSGWNPGDPLELGRFLDSRLVYYPFSGLDWHAIQTFGASGAAHCFVYADLGVPREEFTRTLQREGITVPTSLMDPAAIAERFDEEAAERFVIENPPPPVAVYRPMDTIRELPLEGALTRCGLEEGDPVQTGVGEPSQLYACLTILSAEPAPWYAWPPWPERLALLYIGGEAERAFEALLQQRSLYGWLASTGMQGSSVAFMDHARHLPEWVLTSEDLGGKPFEPCLDARSEVGGGANLDRALFRRST